MQNPSEREGERLVGRDRGCRQVLSEMFKHSDEVENMVKTESWDDSTN